MADPVVNAPGAGGDPGGSQPGTGLHINIGGAAMAGRGNVDVPADHPHPYPRSLLRRVEAPPASPRTLARTPLLELVVVPRTPSLQAAEDALS